MAVSEESGDGLRNGVVCDFDEAVSGVPRGAVISLTNVE